MKRLLAICYLLSAIALFAEIIPSDRRYPWEGNVGVPNGIPDSSQMTVYGTLAATSDYATLQNFIDDCPSNQVAVLGAGTFTFATPNATSDLVIGGNGVVVRGTKVNGTNATTIYIANSCLKIRFRKSISEAALSQDADLSANATKGGTTLTLASVPAWVTVGELIAIDQIDETNFVTSTGTGDGSSYRNLVGQGDRQLAQLNRVLAKDATTITLETPLIYGFKTAQTAQIFQPLYNPSTTTSLKLAGLEDVNITYGYDGNADCHSITMECADRCWLKGVNSTNQAGGAFLWTAFSYRVEMRDCRVEGSRQLDGGEGYGAAPWHVCSGFLIEDNIFTGLHNAMTANAGSTYCVFAYNFEADGQSVAGQNPGMNTHHAHPSFNLFEGNFCEDKLLSDFSFGSSSHTTVFRNRITGENGSDDSRTCVSIEYYNRYWNVVGNLLGTTSLQNKRVSHSGSTAAGTEGSIMRMGGEININSDYTPADAYSYSSGMLVLDYYNFDTVTATNSGLVYDASGSGITDGTLAESLFRTNKPSWFGFLAWPPYSPANATAAALSRTNIPAGYRYVNGTNPPAGGGSPPASPTYLRVTGTARVETIR